MIYLSTFKIFHTPEAVAVNLPSHSKLQTKKIIDFVFLGAWNFKDEILKKEKKFVKQGGRFITHTPYPKII